MYIELPEIGHNQDGELHVNGSAAVEDENEEEEYKNGEEVIDCK